MPLEGLGVLPLTQLLALNVCTLLLGVLLGLATVHVADVRLELRIFVGCAPLVFGQSAPPRAGDLRTWPGLS